MTAIRFWDLVSLSDAYRNGTADPLSVTEEALARGEALQPALNAFQFIDKEGALRQAEAATKRLSTGQSLGPLDGMPLTVKDLTAVKGLPMRRGSLTTSEDAQSEDAPMVARLREAGAVILGKTTTPEFGWKGMTDGPLFGVTRNPWDPSRTPGGSSGGAGAALAAGIGVVAHGTDGGGSIRIPASYGGLVGHKPSFGRVPHHPSQGAFCTDAVQGPLAWTVRDLAIMMNVMAQPDSRDWYALPPEGRDYSTLLRQDLAGLKIAYSPRLGGAEPDEDILRPVRRTIDLCRDLGAEVNEVGSLFPPLEDRFTRYWLARFASSIRELPQEEREKLDPRLRPLAEAGLDVTLAEYDKAMVARARLGRQMKQLLDHFDLLLTPTMPTAPPPANTPYHSEQFDRWRHATPFTLPFNLTGQPATSIPCGLCDAGLPVGLQIVGPPYGDAEVLAAAHALERAIAFPRPHPRLVESLAPN